MFELYNKVLRESNASGCPAVDTLIRSSGLLSQVQIKLQGLGYHLSKLDTKGIATLFCALNDIVFVDNGDSFYLATLSVEKVVDINSQKRLILSPNQDWRRVNTLLESLTVPKINEYLKDGKFCFIKITPNEYANTFICSVGHMSPYPKITTEEVYALSSVVKWHNEVYNASLSQVLRLKLKSGMSLMQNIWTNSRSYGASGYIQGYDAEDNLLRCKVWDVDSYSHAVTEKTIQDLYNGVIKYKNTLITLNKSILCSYYGDSLVNSKLESKNVRLSYCYAELNKLADNISTFHVDRLEKKYGLSYDASTAFELKQMISKDLHKPRRLDGKVHARCLLPIQQITQGHRSYYMTVDLKDLEENGVLVQDIKTILPRKFNYYAITEGLGYVSVSVTATSEKSAKELGKAEFERQFGKEFEFCTLEDTVSNERKGLNTFKVSLESQRGLAEVIHWGYRTDYLSYKNRIVAIFKENFLCIPSDDQIQYVFINSLAKRCPKAGALTIGLVSSELIKFMDLCSDEERLLKKTTEALSNVAKLNAKKEWLGLKRTADYSSYITETIGRDTYIVTQYARFKLVEGGVSSKVELIFKGKYLGTTVFKD